MPLILAFDPIENKHTLDCRKNCIWKPFANLQENTQKIQLVLETMCYC